MPAIIHNKGRFCLVACLLLLWAKGDVHIKRQPCGQKERCGNGLSDHLWWNWIAATISRHPYPTLIHKRKGEVREWVIRSFLMEWIAATIRRQLAPFFSTKLRLWIKMIPPLSFPPPPTPPSRSTFPLPFSRGRDYKRTFNQEEHTEQLVSLFSDLLFLIGSKMTAFSCFFNKGCLCSNSTLHVVSYSTCMLSLCSLREPITIGTEWHVSFLLVLL